uniref:Uncharacterized protein n=1 Tax=Panagrolaimus davidi TaxID=227884 RepID=A0A914QR01_9BILA
MKFGCSIPLLLFFGLLLPTFINAEPKDCDAGGKCYWNGQITVDVIFGMPTKTCDDGICYAFKCMHPDGRIMHGNGCYDDFFNTCLFIQSSILESAKGNNKFTYNDENVIAVSCGELTDLSNCGQTEFMRYAYDKNAAFGLKHNKTQNQLQPCAYEDKFIPPFKPQVQCLKGGRCVTGRTKGPPPMELSNVTCNACAFFLCYVNGKFMTGAGCLNDFERICTNISAAEMQKIKAGKNFYNYIDENNAVSSCAYGDDCHVGLFDFFSSTVMDKIDIIRAPVLARNGEICPYDPPQPKPSEPKSSDPKENGSNGYKLSGMFVLGFIIFYLW